MTAPLVILLTGASSGIGLATAVRAAGEGHHVILVARGSSALQEAADRCRAAGAASAVAAVVDVRDASRVESTVEAAIAEHGRIDAAVHCAGVVAYGRFEEVPQPVFDAVVETNVLGAANVARAVLPHFRRRDSGRLVFVGSVIGQIAAPMMTAYAVSKWGVRSLARQLHVENLDRRGVHVTCVSPGGVDTPIYLQAANYLGVVGRPPPPVASPEKCGRAIMAVLVSPRPRARLSIGVSNPVMVFGFTALPAVFDRLAGPAFGLVATDLRRPVQPTTGNVVTSVPAGNRLHGEQGSPVPAIAAGLGERAGSLGRWWRHRRLPGS